MTNFILRPYRHTILNHSRGKGSSSTGVIAVISAKISRIDGKLIIIKAMIFLLGFSQRVELQNGQGF